MEGILTESTFHLVYFSVLLILLGLRGVKSNLEKGVFLFILLRIIYKLIGTQVQGYNLHYYSIFNLVDMAVITWMIYRQTQKKAVIWFGTLPMLIAFFCFYLTDYSSVSLFGFEDTYPVVSPIGVHQYFDFCCIYSMNVILLCFYWLNEEVNNLDANYLINVQAIICLFSLLAFHGGAFFTMAFARFALPSSNVWYELWGMIYLPIYFLYLTGLTVGGLWKKTQ